MIEDYSIPYPGNTGYLTMHTTDPDWVTYSNLPTESHHCTKCNTLTQSYRKINVCSHCGEKTEAPTCDCGECPDS